MQTALFVAHPGHELRLLGWVHQSQPLLAILTDGSGSKKKPRIQRSIETLKPTGTPHSSIFGSFTDQEVYAAILRQDVDFFWNILETLTAEMTERGVELVVTDLAEGFSPSHDIVHYLGHLLAEKMRAEGKGCESWTFPIQALPHEFPRKDADVRVFELTEEQFQRKVQAARSYEELQREFKAIEEAGEVDFFRKEYIYRTGDEVLAKQYEEAEPYYEEFGRMQVEKGVYDHVLTYKGHMVPLMEELRERVESFKSS